MSAPLQALNVEGLSLIFADNNVLSSRYYPTYALFYTGMRLSEREPRLLNPGKVDAFEVTCTRMFGAVLSFGIRTRRGFNLYGDESIKSHMENPEHLNVFKREDLADRVKALFTKFIGDQFKEGEHPAEYKFYSRGKSTYFQVGEHLYKKCGGDHYGDDFVIKYSYYTIRGEKAYPSYEVGGRSIAVPKGLLPVSREFLMEYLVDQSSQLLSDSVMPRTEKGAQ